jgi:hypothetical protein
LHIRRRYSLPTQSRETASHHRAGGMLTPPAAGPDIQRQLLLLPFIIMPFLLARTLGLSGVHLHSPPGRFGMSGGVPSPSAQKKCRLTCPFEGYVRNE